MTTPTDEVARLDLAARAKVGELSVAGLRWLFVFFSVVIGALAIEPAASFYETLSLRVAAALAGVTTVALWSNFRYKLYFPALFFLSLGLGGGFLRWPMHGTSDRIFGLCHAALVFVLPSYYLWTKAVTFAAVNTPEWDRERSQVDAWWYTLTAPESNKSGIIEFSVGRFWNGYYVYRLIKPGSCWVVAKLWNGKVGASSDYRVRHLSDVAFTLNRNGETRVTIDGRTMRAADISPPGFDCVRANSLSNHR